MADVGILLKTNIRSGLQKKPKVDNLRWLASAPVFVLLRDGWLKGFTNKFYSRRVKRKGRRISLKSFLLLVWVARALLKTHRTLFLRFTFQTRCNMWLFKSFTFFFSFDENLLRIAKDLQLFIFRAVIDCRQAGCQKYSKWREVSRFLCQ